jgi:cold shock CspA family protein
MVDEFDSERFPANFYQGIVVRLDQARGKGVVRSTKGRDISFQFPFVTIIGAELGSRMPGMELLKEGGRVGFDVGWTSKGLRVTTIKPLEHPGSST